MPMQPPRQLAAPLSGRRIASLPPTRVEGTAVYNRQGERLGTVHNFMVDKSTGQVAYAVMSFGGFLGMGESYHPLPWRVLNYDTRQGGFVIDLDRSRLEEAPSYIWRATCRTGPTGPTAAGSTSFTACHPIGP